MAARLYSVRRHHPSRPDSGGFAVLGDCAFPAPGSHPGGGRRATAAAGRGRGGGDEDFSPPMSGGGGRGGAPGCLHRAPPFPSLDSEERFQANRRSSLRPFQVRISEDDEFVLLACDGIWGCNLSQEVIDLVHEKLRTEDTLSSVCEKMLDQCLVPEAGDIIVIVVQFKKPTKSAATTSAEQSAATTEELRPNELMT